MAVFILSNSQLYFFKTIDYCLLNFITYEASFLQTLLTLYLQSTFSKYRNFNYIWDQVIYNVI
jgi:hypothetical protein